MLNFEEVKCIIWDLDETLWEGILEEDEKVVLPSRTRSLIEQIDSCGVIQTICSNNNPKRAEAVLREMGIWDYFIAPMISYESKGPQVQAFCRAMHFRPENCLFIDDNDLNLREVSYCCKGIKTLRDWNIITFVSFFGDERRWSTSRRPFYRMLEAKGIDRATSANTKDFLRQSEIRIAIHKLESVHFERVYELIKRTNQLNYTKKRISRKELKNLLNDERAVCRCVHAWDRYGDYGVIGFIALQDGKAEHFLFSCRVLGMGIEQFCFDYFSISELSVIGPVATEVQRGGDVDWIQIIEEPKFSREKRSVSQKRILLKGPCDIRSVLSYLGNEEIIDTEFTYTNDNGIVIEQINHTEHAVQALTMDVGMSSRIFGDLPFYDENMFSDKMFRNPGYDAICYSIITDSNLGVYLHRKSGLYTAFGEYMYPLTDPVNWKGYIEGTRFTANCRFTEEFLRHFAEEYVFKGRISEERFRQNLITICSHVAPNTQLFLITGVEISFEGNGNPNYADRNLHHIRCRQIVEEVAEAFNHVHVISFSDYVKTQNDFLGHYNHFQKYVYYNFAIDLKYIFEKDNVAGIRTVTI